MSTRKPPSTLRITLESRHWKALARACRSVGGDALRAVRPCEEAAEDGMFGAMERPLESFRNLARWAEEAGAWAAGRALVTELSMTHFRKAE